VHSVIANISGPACNLADEAARVSELIRTAPLHSIELADAIGHATPTQRQALVNRAHCETSKKSLALERIVRTSSSAEEREALAERLDIYSPAFASLIRLPIESLRTVPAYWILLIERLAGRSLLAGHATKAGAVHPYQEDIVKNAVGATGRRWIMPYLDRHHASFSTLVERAQTREERNALRIRLRPTDPRFTHLRKKAVGLEEEFFFASAAVSPEPSNDLRENIRKGLPLHTLLDEHSSVADRLHILRLSIAPHQTFTPIAEFIAATTDDRREIHFLLEHINDVNATAINLHTTGSKYVDYNPQNAVLASLAPKITSDGRFADLREIYFFSLDQNSEALAGCVKDTTPLSDRMSILKWAGRTSPALKRILKTTRNVKEIALLIVKIPPLAEHAPWLDQIETRIQSLPMAASVRMRLLEQLDRKRRSLY
jgi:hypothetical protein